MAWEDTFEKLKKELEEYKNTLVIDETSEVALLLDVIDGEDDFYWVMVSKSKSKGVYHMTCVGKWIALKGKIDDYDYKRLVRDWNLNHSNQAM